MTMRDLAGRRARAILAFGAAAGIATGVYGQAFVVDGLVTMYSLDEASIDGDTVEDVIVH